MEKGFLPLQKPELTDTGNCWQYEKMHLSQVACSQTFYPTKSLPNVRFKMKAEMSFVSFGQCVRRRNQFLGPVLKRSVL